MAGLIKTKKEMVVGKKTYIDRETGEVQEFTVIQKNVSKDFNFHKIWLQDLLNVLNSFGNKKIKILTFLLHKMRNEDNTVTVTYKEIENKLKISKPTISNTMQELIQANVLKKIAPATYRFNPDLIVKGGSGKRQAMLVEYNFESAEEETETIEADSYVPLENLTNI
jgi:hypothetical protein